MAPASDSDDRWMESTGSRWVPIRRLLIAVLLVLAYAWQSNSHDVQTSAPAPDHAPRTPFERPFSPSSFWNTPLPADVALTPDSNVTVQKFNNQWQRYYGTVGINTEDYAIPIYRVGAGQATTKVAIAPGCSQDPALIEQLAEVPMPPGATPASGGDASLVIWQPATGTEWELWQARVDDSGNWSACWGGRITDMQHSNGVFPAPFGLAASGLAYLGGTIKVDELTAGAIEHVVSVSVVETVAGVQVPPANRNDGSSTSDDAIPEGTRFRLDPTIDVTSLGLPPVGVTIARALQRYGMVVTDTAGAVVLMGESAHPYVAAGLGNPYGALFGSTPSYQLLAGIPWNRLQVVSPRVSQEEATGIPGSS